MTFMHTVYTSNKILIDTECPKNNLALKYVNLSIEYDHVLMLKYEKSSAISTVLFIF